MQKGWVLVTTLMVLVLALSVPSYAAHGEKRAVKKAILMVAFGTSVLEAQKVFGRIDVQAKESFPGVEIRWAYSSRIIRAKLAKEGKLLDSPETALAKLMDEHYTHVAILSLHTIPGVEFHELLQNARLFGQMAGGFDKVLIAHPLLSSHEDRVKVAKAMLKNLCLLVVLVGAVAGPVLAAPYTADKIVPLPVPPNPARAAARPSEHQAPRRLT